MNGNYWKFWYLKRVNGFMWFKNCLSTSPFFCPQTQEATLPIRKALGGDWRPAQCSFLVHLAANSLIRPQHREGFFPLQLGMAWPAEWHLQPPLSPQSLQLEHEYNESFGSCQRAFVLLFCGNAIYSLAVSIFTWSWCLAYYVRWFFGDEDKYHDLFLSFYITLLTTTCMRDSAQCSSQAIPEMIK